MKPEFTQYHILTINSYHFRFIGRYRSDLETSNWHYYEKEDGTVIHFRKEQITAVEGDTVEAILENRK